MANTEQETTESLIRQASGEANVGNSASRRAWKELKKRAGDGNSRALEYVLAVAEGDTNSGSSRVRNARKWVENH